MSFLKKRKEKEKEEAEEEKIYTLFLLVGALGVQCGISCISTHVSVGRIKKELERCMMRDLEDAETTDDEVASLTKEKVIVAKESVPDRIHEAAFGRAFLHWVENNADFNGELDEKENDAAYVESKEFFIYDLAENDVVGGKWQIVYPQPEIGRFPLFLTDKTFNCVVTMNVE